MTTGIETLATVPAIFSLDEMRQMLAPGFDASTLDAVKLRRLAAYLEMHELVQLYKVTAAEQSRREAKQMRSMRAKHAAARRKAQPGT